LLARIIKNNFIGEEKGKERRLSFVILCLQ
jgi:hypothetical protein